MASKFISGQGYSVLKSSVSNEDLMSVKEELTVKPYMPQDFEMISGGAKAFKLYQESPNKIYVPKFYGISKFGDPHVNRITHGQDIQLTFKGSLRQEQDAPVKAFLEAARQQHATGGILNLTCASGKTVMAIHLICVLGKKTLVVVHKDFLLQQWKERISQFAPDAKLGLIKAKTVDVEGKDIVLASLQSLCMKDYSPDVFEDFGFVVVDEVHHTSAEIFSRALRKVAFKYTLGLSATINRKDGLSKVFKWYLGNVLYSNVTKKKSVKDRVDIMCSYYYTPDPLYSKEEYMMRDKLNVSKMINNICEYPPRVKHVVDIIHDILCKEPERRVIVLSDRKQHLVNTSEALASKGFTCGHYFGGMKQEDLKESEKCQIILGTFCMVSEGFDCKCLDTLVLASPKSDVIQSVGRILREEPEKRKHVPLVVDVIDEFSIFQRQSLKRIKYYKAQKYNILGERQDSNNARLVKLEGPCFRSIE